MLQIFYTPTTGATASADAHRLCEFVYRDLTGKTARVQKQPSGKPYMDGCHISISHTRALAFAAFSDQPVGLDVEQPRRVNQALLRRCLAPEELQICLQSSQPRLTFLRFWTLKEAYAKYTGEGIRHFPNDLCFTLDGERAALRGSPLYFRTLYVDDAIVSVCTAEPTQISVKPIFMLDK